MNSLALKGSAVLLGGGGLVVGGYYGLKALDYQEPITRTVDNIQKTLEDQKYTLLASGNQHLSTVIQKYKEAIGANDKLKLGDFTGDGTNGKQAFEILLDQCISILKNDYTDSNKLEKAKRWCVEPITTSALLKKQGIIVLNSEANSNDNKQEWEQKVSEYTSETNNQKPKIANLNLNEPSGISLEQKVTKIKEQCKVLGDKENHNDEFEQNLKVFKLWCTK